MKPGMILYREELGMLLMMDPLEQAEAISLLAKRFLLGEDPETENMRVDVFLQIAIPKQEADEEAYAKRSENATKAVRKRYERSTDVYERNTNVYKQEQEQEQEQERGKTRTRAFTPPTIEEIAEYCQSRGNGISAERFFDHYSANGWKVGKTAMKDWKAAVRNWEKNEFREKKEIASHGWDYDQLAEAAYRKAMR